MTHQKSKDVGLFLGLYIPYIITVCDHAREKCPVFPRTYKFLHWGFDDPAEAQGTHEERLAVFRRVRDGLIRKIDEELLAEPGKERATTCPMAPRKYLPTPAFFTVQLL